MRATRVFSPEIGWLEPRAMMTSPATISIPTSPPPPLTEPLPDPEPPISGPIGPG